MLTSITHISTRFAASASKVSSVQLLSPLWKLTATAHLNTNYRHFFLFVDEFSLLSERDLMPMEELNRMILTDTLAK